MLAADRHDESYIAAALQRYLDSEYGELVELSPRIATRKLAAQLAGRDLAAPAVSPILLLKIAYEFTSLIVGTAIYAPDPRLIELRTALRERDETSDAFELERLEVRERAPSPLHGIWFEGNKDHAVIQIRLFGKRAYRVHLKRLAIQHRQVRYTHLILDHEDMFHELAEGEAAYGRECLHRTAVRMSAKLDLKLALKGSSCSGFSDARPARRAPASRGGCPRSSRPDPREASLIYGD